MRKAEGGKSESQACVRPPYRQARFGWCFDERSETVKRRETMLLSRADSFGGPEVGVKPLRGGVGEEAVEL